MPGLFDPTRIGRMFFALGLLGLGIEHFIFGVFVTGRAPAWPASVPGGWLWAYLTGIVVVASAGAILLGKRARAAAILLAVLIAAWALVRHVPVLVTTAFLSNVWTMAGKALTFTGGALAVAATFPAIHATHQTPLARLMNLGGELIVIGRLCLGTFLVITGIQHFLFTPFVASLIPAWFPGDAVFWTYFAGVALLCGGVGLFIPRTARLAGLLSGLMVFSWFWIIHIPRTFVGVSDSIAVFEALAVSGVAFVVSGASSSPPSGIPSGPHSDVQRA